ELLAAFRIPRAMLPRIASSSEKYGVATIDELRDVPIAGILGDQQAALVGQTCFRAGEAKNTYGTGCFLLMNTGANCTPSRHGLTRYTNKGHLARAVLEATAYQTREVVEAMEKDAGFPVDVLRTDGGMVGNELLMQFQSDILGRPVVRPAVQETTALGAAYAAGLAVGFFKDCDDLRGRWSVDRTWTPRMAAGRRQELYGFWKKAVTRSFDWLD